MHQSARLLFEILNIDAKLDPEEGFLKFPF